MSRGREMGRGYDWPRYPCNSEDFPLLARLLERDFSAHVEPAKTRFEDGRLVYEIDLGTLPVGEGSLMRERITRALDTARSRHKLPTIPPTSA